MSPQAGALLLHEIASRLRKHIPHAVPRVGAEDAEELVLYAVAAAASLLASAERYGKPAKEARVLPAHHHPKLRWPATL